MSKSVKMRDRKSESSSRLVQCYYCGVEKSQGKRDRAKEEIFLRENQVPLDDLPLEGLNKEWLKTHLPALKSKSNRDVTVENYISNATPKHQFWIT